MMKENKKGILLAVVALLLTAALFVGAAGADGAVLKVGTGQTNTTISDALATLLESDAGSATIEIYGEIIEMDGNSNPDGVIKNAKIGWNYTFIGKTEDAKINLSAKTSAGSHISSSVSELKFKDLTLTFSPDAVSGSGDAAYRGFQHTGLEEYTNCTINGFFKTYAPTVKFDTCKFFQSKYEYHFWVYGESTTTFTNCEFDNLGKAAKIYREGNQLLDVTFTDCTFRAHDIPEGKGKAAIEIDSTYCPVNLTVKSCTVTSYKEGLLSGNTLWNNEPNAGTMNSTKDTYVTFTLTLDPNGGSLSDESTRDITYNATVVSKDGQPHNANVADSQKPELFKIQGSAYGDLPTPTKADASFDGWYTAATGGTKVTKDTVIESKDAVEHTLYAHWSAIATPVTVTFNTDGGQPEPDKKTISSGECVNEPENPTKDGFNFTGWYLNDNLYNFNTPVTQDLTLTAHWSEVEPVYYTVTFNTMDGSPVPPEQEVISGGYVTKPENPTRGNDTFLGWFRDDVEFVFTSFNVKENLALVAHWKIAIPESETEIQEIVDKVKESKGGVVVDVSGTTTDTVAKLITKAQENGVVDKVQLEVNDPSNAAVVGEAINTAVSSGKSVPVTVTDTNKDTVKAVLNNVEDKSKVSLPVSGDGTNIETILDISKAYPKADVHVPKAIVVKEETEMKMNDAKVVTLENIAKAAKEGGSGAKLILDLETKDLNVQNAVSILGNIDATIQTKQLPNDVIITTTPKDITEEHGRLKPEDGADVSAVSVVKVEGVNAAAVSKKNEKTIEKEDKIEPQKPEVTRGYEEQKVHTVFQIVVPEIRPEAVTVTFEVTLKNGEDSSKLSSFYLKHYNGNGWDANHIPQSAAPVHSSGNTYKLTFTLKTFSPFALVSETAVPRSSGSSSSGGSSIWLPATAQPTAQPTAEPTATPSVVPVKTPTPVPETPAPFIGILAGLGAAAAVFGLRRK